MNLLSELEKLLRQDDRLHAEGKLLKNKIVELAYKLDEQLIDLLLSHDKFKELFFRKVGKATIFDQNKFQTFVSNKEFLPDSFTAYKNKIGLTDSKGDFISQSKDVVLSFPYKDCVLEGGQDKEDAKRDEIFYNKVLASDEIDRLFEPKVLTNFKKYDKGGEHEVDEITMDNNLIIKGNNLLALHSLKSRYAGKVKLIYIDPPYNTGNDGFNYNDSFNHSTWLVFMKNRLEIARELLSETGVIFVQADYNEAHYLKILLDEVFGRDRFINEIIWKRKFGNANESRRLGSAFDNIYLYAKTDNYRINLIREKTSKHVKNYIESRFTRKDDTGKHKGKKWMPYPLANPGSPTPNLIYDYKGYKPPKKGWRMVKEKLEALDKDERIYFPEDKTKRLQEKKFLDEYEGQPIDALWTDIYVINSQSDEALNFDGQKPEDLLKRIIEIGSDTGDIVLDYHLGSGTTASVAMKLGRRFIGIEQMNYGEKDAILRLESTVHGDNTGISKKVSWEGGGSFVELELLESNSTYLSILQESNNYEAVLKRIKDSGFLTHKVDLEKLDVDEFKKLSKQEQKQLLIEVLDANHLYVNLSDIDDERFEVSEKDKKLNKQFYGI